MGFVSKNKPLEIPEKFFEFRDDGVTVIFGLELFVAANGYWAFSRPTGAPPMIGTHIFTAPDYSFTETYHNVIRNDIAKGKGDQIAYIRATNRETAILMFCEIITKQHFLTAECGYDDYGLPYIKLSGVFFADRMFPVVIYHEDSPIEKLRAQSFATIDKWGQVIEN